MRIETYIPLLWGYAAHTSPFGVEVGFCIVMGVNEMKERIREVLERRFRTSPLVRRRVKLAELEEAVMQSFEYNGDYYDAGGRSAFAGGIEGLAAEGYLTPIVKKTKYSTTHLEQAYWLAVHASGPEGWSEPDMMRVIGAQPLNLDYYRKHPEAQTAEVWEYIERIYQFMRNAADREIITREERSLALFDQEKFLAEREGRQLLARLGLNLELLRAELVHEAFEYYLMPDRPVRRILISENHSFYHSAKKIMQKERTVCGMRPDMLIYGEGWKIVSSLYFLAERGIDPLDVELFYVGDMDKKGWEIYGTLKLGYPELKLRLALPVYSAMHKQAHRTYVYAKEQSACPPQHLELVRQEAAAVPGLLVCVDTLLKENRRIPQEVLNYEVMARLASG